MATTTTPPSKRRGYSKEFTPSDRAASKRYLLDKIPASLWIAARARARAEGLSMRALILHMLTAYTDDSMQPADKAWRTIRATAAAAVGSDRARHPAITEEKS